ncbi:hypothetical protein NVP1121O_084 [Vibrio phage 1.121.O._10N.286.46.C4]|nr:hypothetical protein NVP1121O_084 [Vibrio phage 1.121.O._10N.286.46.C4]
MFEQLPSKYFKEDGVFKIRYAVKLTKPWAHRFSNSDLDWIEAIGEIHTGECPEITLSEMGTVASWVEESSQKAIRYTEDELKFMLRHTVY